MGEYTDCQNILYEDRSDWNGDLMRFQKRKRPPDILAIAIYFSYNDCFPETAGKADRFQRIQQIQNIFTDFVQLALDMQSKTRLVGQVLDAAHIASAAQSAGHYKITRCAALPEKNPQEEATTDQTLREIATSSLCLTGTRPRLISKNLPK
jgi:hypothetical protein